jgi:hypothetical protein
VRGKRTKLGEGEGTKGTEIPKIIQKNSGFSPFSGFGKITFGIITFGKSSWRPKLKLV